MRVRIGSLIVRVYPASMKLLAENIRELRSRFANQSDFGDKVGVGQSTVVRWENGSDPKPEKLLALARVAGCSVDELLTLPLSKIPTRQPDQILSEQELTEMLAEAQREIPAGASLGDWPRYAASSLRTQLERYLTGRAILSDQETTDRAIAAPSRAPTRRSARVK